jgi:AsmA protein
MRTLKILGGVIAAIVVVAALLLVIGMPAGFLTSTIADRVERDTGYHLTVGGSTKVGLWPSLNVIMSDVTLEAPNDRETGSRLTIGHIQADMTLGSLWSGRPEITELVINRPDIRVPLRRERRTAAANAPSSRPGAAAAPKIQRITVTDGAVTFFNARDHVENRIEGIGARATIDADRHLGLNGKAQAGGHPLTFTVKASMPDPSVERQTIPVELTLDAPGLLQAPLSSEAQVRINGTVVMINGLSGKIGDGLFDGWASVDLASKPLVKVDLNFRRLDIATATQAAPQGAQQPAWSDDAIELTGLNYADAQIRLSATELNIGSAHFAPVALEASLASGILKGNISSLGAYGGQASGTIEVDVSNDKSVYAIRCDLNGVRALPLLSAAADFDKLDGRLQAKIDVRSTGQSQQAIMSNLQGKVTANFQDGAIRGLNVAQMIRSLTSGTLSGWQASQEQSTDLSQLSASFRIDKGLATTADLNLIGPLVKMTGSGAIDVGAKTLALRVDPKLVLTTEGQGRAGDPVGLGIPVVIDGPWASPSIYPDVAAIVPGGNPADGNNQSDTLGKLGEALGKLIQQGLSDSQNRNPPPNGRRPNDPAQPDQSGRQINDMLKQLFGR